MRLFLLTAVFLFTVAAPAAGAVTPLLRVTPAPEEHVPAYALAGDEVLVERTLRRAVQVVAVPAAGGGRPVERLRVSKRRYGRALLTLGGSAQAAAAVLSTNGPERARPFTGPAGGRLVAATPLRPGGRRRFLPFYPIVTGDRTFFWEVRGDFARERLAVHKPRPGEPATIDVTQRSAATIEGDLLVYVTRSSRNDEEPGRVVARDWRTGAERWRKDLEGEVDTLDVHPDGRVAVGAGSTVLEIAAGGTAVRTVATDAASMSGSSFPFYAGDAIVFARQGTRDGDPVAMAVATPDGGERPFGVPAGRLGHPVADDERIVWLADGCLLSAPVDAPAQDAIDPGACARTTMTFVDSASPQRLLPGRRVRIVLHCVAAPPPGCRGTLTLPFAEQDGHAARPARFLIPAGQDGRFTLRLSREGFRRVRREGRDGFGAAVLIRATTADPEGRRSTLRDLHVLDPAIK